MQRSWKQETRGRELYKGQVVTGWCRRHGGINKIFSKAIMANDNSPLRMSKPPYN